MDAATISSNGQFGVTITSVVNTTASNATVMDMTIGAICWLQAMTLR